MVEHADARQLFHRTLGRAVVVGGLSRQILRRERDVIVKVELVAGRRHPCERPPHTLPEGLELAQRRARDRYEADVPRSEVHDAALEIVGPERTALAPLLPFRREHEMVDDQLRAPGEQVAERDLAVRSVEHVRLVDGYPW